MKTFLLLALCTASFLSQAQKPKLMLPTGHVFRVEDVDFSPDGEYILTASSNEVKVWETASGRLIHNLKGNTLETFYNEGTRFVTQVSHSDTSGVLHFWDFASGALIRTIDGYSADVSENDSLMLIATGDSVRVVDMASKHTLYKLPGQLGRFTRNGRFIFTGSLTDNEDGFIMRFWDPVNRGLVHHHEGLLAGMSENRMGLAQDSVLYIVDANTGAYLQAFSTLDEGVSYSYKVRFSADDKLMAFFLDQTPNADRPIIFVDGETFEVTRTLDLPLDTHEVVFHRDGVSFFTIDAAGSATRWDRQTFEEIFRLEGHHKTITRMVFSADDKYILTASEDNTAILWDAATGRLVRRFEGTNRMVEAGVLSGDGGYFATYVNGGLSVWETATGTRLTKVSCSADEIRFSADDKYLIANQSYLSVGETPHTATVVDVATWKVARAVPADSVSSCEISPDGRLFGIITNQGHLRVSNLDGEEIFQLARAPDKEIDEVSFSPDGKTLFVLYERYNDQTRLAAFDLNTGRMRWEFVDEYINDDFKCTDDNRYLVVRNASVFCIGVADGKVREMAEPENASPYKVYLSWVGKEIESSPDGRHVMIHAPHDVLVFNIESMEPVLNLSPEESITMAHFADAATIVYGDDQGLLRWYDLGSGKEIRHMALSGFAEDMKGGILLTSDHTLQYIYKDFDLKYSLLTFDEKAHIVMDREGRYDGTEGARELVYFTCGMEVISLDQVKDQLWVPQLAERIMSGETINATRIDDLDICGYTPMVEEERATNEYRFRITPRRGGLGETVLYVNDIEVRRFEPGALIPENDGYVLRVKIHDVERFFVAGEENTVSVRAFTSDNDMGSRGATLEGEATTALIEPPSLHAVIVGVSDYKGDGIDLKFASKDARDFANALDAAASGLFSFDGVDRVHVYTLHTDRDRNFFPDKASIKQTFTKIGAVARSNDVLLIFFAGHGVTNPKDKQFYFMTADASAMTDPEATGISARELFEWIQPANVPAQKRILILDACNSGQAINDIVTMGGQEQQYVAARSDEQMRYIKAIDKLNERAGLFILSASASDQSAYEMGRYNQGVLTYSLLKPLKEDPGILDDNRLLNVGRWFDAAEQIVGEIARSSGARQQPQIIRTTNFNVGVVDEAVRSMITLPTEKPLFSNCNFQDEDLMTDNLRLNVKLDAALSDLSSRSVDSPITFFPGSTSPDAVQISGRYRVEGENIAVRVVVRMRDQILKRFEVTGKVANVDGLAHEVLQGSLK